LKDPSTILFRTSQILQLVMPSSIHT